MHDPEKSDSAVVAGKSPNKAGLPAAEVAKQRAGTKGSADQQSTHRTQTRARLTQALNRVRQVARQRKKERFTALLHDVNVDTLSAAFYALKRKAAAGVDGVTWQDYEVNLERNLEDLHARVGHPVNRFGRSEQSPLLVGLACAEIYMRSTLQRLQMESMMSPLALRNASSSSAANRACFERRGLSRFGYATMAALVLAAAGAFISTEPAAAASSERTTYCLSSDSQSDCSFTSLAQCEATASGGLGVCDSNTVWPGERGPEEFFRSHAALHVGPR